MIRLSSYETAWELLNKYHWNYCQYRQTRLVWSNQDCAWRLLTVFDISSIYVCMNIFHRKLGTQYDHSQRSPHIVVDLTIWWNKVYHSDIRNNDLNNANFSKLSINNQENQAALKMWVIRLHRSSGFIEAFYYASREQHMWYVCTNNIYFDTRLEFGSWNLAPQRIIIYQV